MQSFIITPQQTTGGNKTTLRSRKEPSRDSCQETNGVMQSSKCIHAVILGHKTTLSTQTVQHTYVTRKCARLRGTKWEIKRFLAPEIPRLNCYFRCWSLYVTTFRDTDR